MKAQTAGLFHRYIPSGSTWALGYRLASVNARGFGLQFFVAVLTAITYYGPAFFMQMFIAYLEVDPNRINVREGCLFVVGLILASVLSVLSTFLPSCAYGNRLINVRSLAATLEYINIRA